MRRTRFALAVLTTAVLLAACSHNTPTSSVSAGSPAGATTSASAPIAGIGSGVPGAIASAVAGQLDVSKLCAAVPQADVQKLFKATAPSVTANPLECAWGPSMTVDIYANDPAKKYLQDLFGSSPTQLSGLKFSAEWSEPVEDATVPDVGCSNGKTSITVSPGLDVDQTTLTYTGSDPFFKVDPASAAQYATEEAALCGDLYQAGA